MKRDTRIMIGICLVFLYAAVVLFFRGQKDSGIFGVFAPEGSTAGLILEQSPAEEIFSEQKSGEESDSKESDSLEEEEEAECAVSVLGAVKHPGVYRYQGNARVCDAIDASGGFKKNAAETSVNLAKPLVDGEQILVLTKKQMKKEKKEKKETSPDTSVSDDGRVNINLAAKEDLMKLPGIGEAKALLIIDYRTEHGNFEKPEDLMKISGIKEGIYQKIKEWITV